MLPLFRLLSAWPQVARRAIANWRLMSTVIVGVLLASAIMSGTVIYFDALRELALKNALAPLTIQETNITIKTDRGPTTYVERDKVVRAAEREISTRMEWVLRDRVAGVKTATFFLSDIGEEASADVDSPRSFFAYLPRLSEQVTLETGGRMPGDSAAPSATDTPTLEAVVPLDEARQIGAEVGDTFAAVPYWSDSSEFIHVNITGTFTRNDPDNEYWDLNDRVFLAATGSSFQTLPFYVTERAYYEILGDSMRQMDSTYGWLLMVDTGQLNALNSRTALGSIISLEDQLETQLYSYRQVTELDEALANYDRRLFFSKLPMFVILILISVVILYYVITLSSLVVEQQRGDIVLLKSRGASAAQVLSVYVLEGLTIAVLAVALAPMLASAVISLLGFTPAFSDLSGGSRMSAALSPGAYIMSSFGGILSFAALMIPAVQASRMSVTTFRHQSARPYSQPFYQRFYLDVLLLLIGVLLLRQLSEQGSVVAVSIFGEAMVDQALLAVPAVILVASSLALLRLFPLFMRVSSALLSSFLPAGLALGVWQMARNPTHYARLSLLLILMAGLGIFAASIGGTIQRSFEERALYETGADVRIQGTLLNFSGYTRPMRESFEELPSVESVSVAFRGFGSDLSKLLGDSYTMFAVESSLMKEIGWFRDDFSEAPMEKMLESLSPTVELPTGVEIPAGAVSLGAAVRVDRPHPNVVLAARVRDANDRHFTYELGHLLGSQWATLERPLLRVERTSGRQALQPVEPLRLMSLTIYQSESRQRLRAGSMLVDEIYARMPNGETLAVETFDSLSGWNTMRAVPESQSDALRASSVGVPSSANFVWGEGRPIVSRGIFAGPPIQPLPVIASSRFLRVNDHRVGETFEVSAQGHRMRVTVVGELDYFPTLDTFDRSYLLADLSTLLAYTNLETTGGEVRPNEVWITTDGSEDERAELVSMLEDGKPFSSRRVFDREQALADSQADPLVEAGWRALLFMAFSAVLVLSGLGFMVHAYVSFKSREMQFALMRTVGFSMGQLTTLVLMEQVLVIGAGLALGTWMGGRLGASMLPFLAHDDQGAHVLPPFIVDVNWGTLALTYAAMALLFAIIIAGVIILVRRISLQRILRLGEM